MEGTQEHFKKLQEFAQSDEFGYLGAEHVPLFRAYLEQVGQLMANEQAQAALLAAAQQFQQGSQKPGMPGPAAGPQDIGGTPMLQGAELADETLPSAGGGANLGVVH